MGTEYNPLHGRPSKCLQEDISRRVDGILGGVIIGQDNEGRDWIRELATIHNGKGELSLDDFVYLSETVGGIYREMTENLKKTNDLFQTNPPPQKDFMHFSAGIYCLNDALKKEHGDHMLSQLDPTAQALELKLGMFELEGYSTATLAKRELKRSSDGYQEELNRAYEIAYEHAVKLTQKSKKRVATSNPP